MPQPIKAKLDPNQQDAMIQFACRPPPSNAESITSLGRQLMKLDDNRFLSTFGIAVDPQLITVSGRELRPPSGRLPEQEQQPCAGFAERWRLAYERV